MVWKPLTRLFNSANLSPLPKRLDITSTESNTAIARPSKISNDDHVAVPASSSVTLQVPGVDLQLDVEGGTEAGMCQMCAVKCVAVDQTLVSAKDEIAATQTLDANGSSISETSFVPVVENDVNEMVKASLPTFNRNVKKVPFTTNWDLMDDMLDGMLTMRSFINVEDTSGNTESMKQAEAEGVKIRDFAAKPVPQDTTTARHKHDTTLLLQDRPVPEVFRAHGKALEFFYMSYLIHSGIYDLPTLSFTVEDVDRLYTCGMIDDEDLNHPFLHSLLGHGVYRRLRRATGRPTLAGDILPPRGCWIIPFNSRRPTKDEMYHYVRNNEVMRFSRPNLGNGYRIAAFERPVFSDEYREHRIQRDGHYGLKRMAYKTDDQVKRMILVKDETFFPTEAFVRVEIVETLHPSPDLAVPTAPQLGNSSPAVVSPQDTGPYSSTQARGTSIVVPVPDPSSAVASSSEPIQLSSSSEAVSQPCTPVRGCSIVAKGKKRSRSPSVSSVPDGDGPHRRTRARVSSQSSDPSTTSHVSPRTARLLRRSSRKITAGELKPEALSLPPLSSAPIPPPSFSPSKGKKRARDDEPENGVFQESSPEKKPRTANAVASTAPVGPELSGPAPAERDIEAPAAPTVAGNLIESTGRTGYTLRKASLPVLPIQMQKMLDIAIGEFFEARACVYRPSWSELCGRPGMFFDLKFTVEPKAKMRYPQPQRRTKGPLRRSI